MNDTLIYYATWCIADPNCYISGDDLRISDGVLANMATNCIFDFMWNI